ncbi:MAG: antitoxin [Chloroflexi bacterium]|nr:antitoxin [Chloroflexota bacterium]
MITLDPEEKELLESVENGEWQSVPQVKEEIVRYQRYATAALASQQVVTIHLPRQEFALLQAKANEAGVSYETLITQLIQNFVGTASSQLGD